MDIWALVLRCNNFEFHDKHYVQISGVAMGTKVAPTIANLYMGNFEDKYVYTYPLQPLFYGRFIDDGFFIWQHGNISYLDLIVRLDPEGNISTSLYTKETDTHSFLHYTSSHPQHMKDSGP